MTLVLKGYVLSFSCSELAQVIVLFIPFLERIQFLRVVKQQQLTGYDLEACGIYRDFAAKCQAIRAKIELRRVFIGVPAEFPVPVVN